MPDHKKLLIVDDSTFSRALLRRIVRALRPEWEMAEATDGEAAMQLVKAEHFDFATVDINMPGMDGLELTARFRAECPQLRVCLVSANVQEDSRRQAQELHAGFVKKPITPASVAETINYFEGLK